MRMLLVKAHNVELARQRPEVLRDLAQVGRLGLESGEKLGRRFVGHGRHDVRHIGRPAGGVGAAVGGAEEHDSVRVVEDVGEAVVFRVLECLGVTVR